MLEIDRPTNKTDNENIRWYLSHKDTTIYVIRRKWYLHVDSPCRFLDDKGRCANYENRPKICREHDPAHCEFHTDFDSDLSFTSLKQFDEYLRARLLQKKHKSRAKLRKSA